MNKLIPVGLGAAALVVALLLGSRFIGSPSSNVGGPAVQPTATGEPTATAEPSGSVAAGLPEGPHLLYEGTGGGVSITVTIAGSDWAGEPGGQWVLWNESADQSNGAGVIGFEGREYYVYGDACHWSGTKPDTPAATVDELVNAVANQGSREASAPEDITVDGYAGKKIILHMADDVDIDACDEGLFALFGQQGDDLARYSEGPGQIEELWAIDVDGRIVVLDGNYFADSPQNAVDELRAILASATFE